MLASIFNRQIRISFASSSRLRLDSTFPLTGSSSIHRFNVHSSTNSLLWDASYEGIPSQKAVESLIAEGMDEEEIERIISEKLRAYKASKNAVTPRKFVDREEKLAERVKPDPTQPLPHLPGKEEWHKLFFGLPGINSRHRYFVSNLESAKKVIDSLGLEEQSERCGEKITVIEGYPGIGSLTRDLLKRDCVEKVITLEKQLPYYQAMENLRKDPTLAEHEREKLVNVPLSCYYWDTYDEILNKGLLDHIPSIREGRQQKPDYSQGLFHHDSWQKPSSILFLGQMPNTVHSEQLLSQFLRAIPNRYWLFRYSRVRMAFICSEQLASRCLAKPSERLYSKFSLVSTAMVDREKVLDANSFTPYADHFWPLSPVIGPQLPITVRMSSIKDHRLRPTPAKQLLCLLTLEPKKKPLLEGNGELEAFDYLTKNLFVLRTHTIKEALLHLAPGAAKILTMMRSGNHPAMREMRHIQINDDEKVNELSVDQLIALSKMFDRWPFRPASLIEDGRIEDIADGLHIF